MNKFLFFSFCMLSIITNKLYAEEAPVKQLSCSAKGTVIYTVNGVNTSEPESTVNSVAIGEEVDKYPKQLDKLGVVNVKGIYNPTHQIHLDVLEGVSQELKSRYNIKNPWIYISQAIAGVSREQFRLYYESNKSPLGLGVINTVAYAFATQRIHHLRNFNSELEQADANVVEKVKVAVQKDLDKNIKVIVIPHSQGNFVVNAALEKLKEDASFENKYNPILGALHVATPSGYSAISKSAVIKLNSDLVVNNPIVRLISVPPTYEQKYFIGYTFVDNMLTSLASGLVDFVSSNKVDVTGHSMVDTYLSDTKEARKIGGTAGYSSMAEIFKANLVYVAKELDDNCLEPEIAIKVDGAILNALKPNTYDYQNFTSHENKLKIDVTDKNDTDDSTTFTLRYYNSFDSFWFRVENLVTVQEKSISDFVFPFSNTSFRLEVTATNKYEKTSQKSFEIITTFDRAPVVTTVIAKCEVDFQGNATGNYQYYGLNVVDPDSGSYPPAMKGFIGVSEDEIYRIDTIYYGVGGVYLNFPSSSTVSTRYYISPCN